MFLSQPFRANPDYDEVTDLPYNTTCLSNAATAGEKLDLMTINKCQMKTIYNTTCILDKMYKKVAQNVSINYNDVIDCVLARRKGASYLKTAVVPMWIFYQFLVSVVLLLSLIHI